MFQCIVDIMIKACSDNCIENILRVMICQVCDISRYIAYNCKHNCHTNNVPTYNLVYNISIAYSL